MSEKKPRLSRKAAMKEQQGYQLKPNTCGNCKHYDSQIVHVSQPYEHATFEWTEEKHKFCTLGRFAVNKTATCDNHELNNG